MEYGTSNTSGTTTSSSDSQSQEIDEGYSAMASSTQHIFTPSNHHVEVERDPFSNPITIGNGGMSPISNVNVNNNVFIGSLPSSTTPTPTSVIPPFITSGSNTNTTVTNMGMGMGGTVGTGTAVGTGTGTGTRVGTGTAGMSTSDLGIPHPPFMSSSNRGSVSTLGGGSGSGSGRESPGLLGMEHKLTSGSSSVSLSAHFLPNKFSSTMLNGGVRKRKGLGKGGDGNGNGGKGGGGGGGMKMPKMGGGSEAFRSGEARMPVDGDDDYDGVNIKGGLFATLSGGGTVEGGQRKKMRWNRFKWILFFANLCLSAYTLIGLIICLLTYFGVWSKVDVIRVGNTTELALSTLAMAFGVFTSLIGWAGILLNNRSFLAIHALLLWITFIFLVAPGYITYKKHSFNLEGKINAQWSRDLGSSGRLRIQNQLECCGYFSPFIEATISQTCYSRSILPGCKLPYMVFERMVLKRWYTIVFSLVPLHLVVMVVSLLCSNHVTYRFGKGMMPKEYRLSLESMKVIVDQYANQLAEQYGNDVASEVIERSKSNMTLNNLTMSRPASGTVSATGTGTGNNTNGSGNTSGSGNGGSKFGSSMSGSGNGMGGRYDSFGKIED